MSTPIFVQDVTLRDGMHAVRHRISTEDVQRIVAALDRAGVDAIEVAHGDGLAGSSLNYGPGSHTDWAWIEAAASVLERARLTTLLLPGVGTDPASCGRRTTSASARSGWPRTAPRRTSRPSTSRRRANSAWTCRASWMLSRMAPPAELAEQARLMESYGAHCVYAHRLGRPAHHERRRRPGRAYRDVLRPETEIGIHAHENLSLSVANSVVAVENGCFRVDASLAGHGAGAGNCPLEAFVAVADLSDFEHRCDLFALQDAADDLVLAAAGPPGAGGPGDA
ncbi:4-hydroxy-2-oxovalerate aldolase [Yinghuangia aomiensis]